MLNFKIKYEENSENAKPMSEMMKDLIAIEERADESSPKRKAAILMLEEMNKKDSSMSFRSNDEWDKKENMIHLIESIEKLTWIHSVIEIKREKK